MKLFYCRIEGGNFGDDMNLWFWDTIFPEFHGLYPDYTLFGIGSILGRDFLSPFEKVLVLGSGSGYGPLPDNLSTHVLYGWVRGPLTSKNLGLSDDMALTDPACLVPLIDEFKDIQIDGDDFSDCIFLPHCGTDRLGLDWSRVAVSAGMKYVSPRWDSKHVIRQIASSRRVVTESLHGAIIADAFRIPWVPVAIGPGFSSYKWTDWARSLEMDVKIAPALKSAKKVYFLFKNLFGRSKSQPPSGIRSGGFSEQHGEVRLPSRQALLGKGEEFRLDGRDKRIVRNIMSVSIPFIERMLINDLRATTKLSGQLSAEGVLKQRQEQILERLEKVRLGDVF